LKRNSGGCKEWKTRRSRGSSRLKNSPLLVDPYTVWERVQDPKGQTGRRPVMGRKAKLSARKTLRFVELLIVRLGAHKNARGRRRRRCSLPRVARGRA
jgi:hypothetical protein